MVFELFFPSAALPAMCRFSIAGLGSGFIEEDRWGFIFSAVLVLIWDSCSVLTHCNCTLASSSFSSSFFVIPSSIRRRIRVIVLPANQCHVMRNDGLRICHICNVNTTFSSTHRWVCHPERQIKFFCLKLREGGRNLPLMSQKQNCEISCEKIENCTHVLFSGLRFLFAYVLCSAVSAQVRGVRNK